MTEVSTERLRHLVRFVAEKHESDEEVLCVDLEHMEIATGRLTGDVDNLVSLPGDRVRFAEGDVLVSKLRPYLAKSWRATAPGAASSELMVLRPTSRINPRWLAYVVQSTPFVDFTVATAKGVKMPRTSPEEVGDYSLHLPDLDEQEQLANFLDRETQRISETMTAAQRLVELARERFAVQAMNEIRGTLDQASNAGLQWLGPVAVDRDVCRLGYRYEVQLGKMLNPDAASGEELRPYLRNVNVQWDRIDVEDVNEMSFDASDRARFSLRSGDLLVCEGGDVGRCAIWEEQLPECYYQKALHRLRPRSPSKDVPRYLYYVLWAASRQGLFASDGNQNTIPHLTAEQLRAHRFPFPSREVQEQVVERLDSWKRGVSDVESLAIHQSRLLEERRQALITAAVSGQLDVEAVA